MKSLGNMAWLALHGIAGPSRAAIGARIGPNSWVFIASILLSVSAVSLRAENPPPVQWQKSFGASNVVQNVVKTGDGGYLLAGTSGFGAGEFGGVDYWALKVDAKFDKLWESYFGGKGFDYFGGESSDRLSNLPQTADGGYLLSGDSNSGLTGNKSAASYGGEDYWVLKIDGNGNKIWENSFGGLSNELFADARSAGDGGFILGGEAYSGISGNKTAANYGSGDFWVVKIDAGGKKVWEKSFGGTGRDSLRSLLQTRDGGYILGGYTGSGVSGNKTTGKFGPWNYWVVKLDAGGNKTWEKTFGGNNTDLLANVQQTSDEGYILVGQSNSGISGAKTSPNYGANDCWLVKIDKNGNKLWDKSFGGSRTEQFVSLQQTPDNGFILGGLSNSGVSGNKTTPNYGDYDYWVVRMDGLGNIIWDNAFGGGGLEQLRTVTLTADGGFVLSGASYSDISGNKTTPNQGGADYWVVKIDGDGRKVWEGDYGGSGDDYLERALEMADGGLVLFGSSISNSSGNKTTAESGPWLVRLSGAAPSLTAERSGNNVILSWPAWASEYHLVHSTELNALGGWPAILQHSVTNNAVISVAVPLSTAGDFFLLKSN